jgi:hypothetical protein
VGREGRGTGPCRFAPTARTEPIACAIVAECHFSGHGCFMGARSFRALLPKRLRARVHHPEELRMGSPQYGQLVLDGEVLSGSLAIEATSLRWSGDGRRLAAQELVSWPDGPITRVVVFDVERRTRIAASPPRRGIANPVSFESDGLIYRRWHERVGNQELRLKLGSD